jgi:RHS repeat-associated protein
LTGAADANHSLSWTYDPLGRVTGKGLVIGSVTLSVGYAYTNGDLVTLVTPSGQTITYGYTNHQITSVSVNGAAIATSVTYEPFGAVNGWTWGNATTVARTYDGDEKITQISTAGDTISFGYDNANRVTGITDTNISANSWTLGYDLLDRLTSAAETGTTLGWTHDANGNRLTQTGANASTFTPSTTSNQLNAITGALPRTYSYDAAGDTTGYATDSFSYNQRGRMSSATTGSNSTSYLYNALGQMMEKSNSTGATYLMYDEAGHIIGEYSSSGAFIEETVWMGDTPVATLQPNGSTVSVYYIHTDQLNAPRVITQPSTNTVAWRWDTDPFGTVATNQNPAGLGTFIYNLRFPGQYYLPETGLYYNYFRDYDPQTGRYLESDPFGLFGGSWSTYGYVGGNPISAIDPFGLYPAIEVTLPNGTTYIPMTIVKNPAQAAAYGLPVGAATAIATPPGANPQGDVSCWANAKDKSFRAFKNYWADPAHNYKVVNGPMYDAYGNFEFGATGAAAGFPLLILQGAADYLHNWNNNPINTTDINSGFNAIAAGGRLSIIDYNPPALGSH